MRKAKKPKETRTKSNVESEPRLSAQDIIKLLEPDYGPYVMDRRLDPAHELVFTILSQHTSDTNSERAFKRLMGDFGTLEAVADGDVQLIARAINIGGLAQVKAPRIKEILNIIRRKLGDVDLNFLRDMPLNQAKAWLRDLPGIGPKSAAVILCFSLGMPALAVDTHVHRVAKRLGLIGPKVNADDAHDILEAMVSPNEVYSFHVALISHGRRICKALKPRCADCALAGGCPSNGVFV